ncbi:hypothetical protein Q8F55_001487 [Vanrija albida]|uniref:RNase III domain-containing protein n=1 Tax=Vanrija albida TaxID=181172 RepID=A0ABR3QGB8_9TREE
MVPGATSALVLEDTDNPMTSAPLQSDPFAIREEPASVSYTAYWPMVRGANGERSLFVATVPRSLSLSHTVTPAVDKYGVPRPSAALMELVKSLNLALQSWANVLALSDYDRTPKFQLRREMAEELASKILYAKTSLHQLEYTLKALAIVPRTGPESRRAFLRAVAIATCGHSGKRTSNGAPLPLHQAYSDGGYAVGQGVIKALEIDEQLAVSVIYYSFVSRDLHTLINNCNPVVKRRPIITTLLRQNQECTG